MPVTGGRPDLPSGGPLTSTAELTAAVAAHAADTTSVHGAYELRGLQGSRHRAEGVVVDDLSTAAPWDRLSSGTGTITASTGDATYGNYFEFAVTSAGAAKRAGRYFHADMTHKFLSMKVRKADVNLSAFRLFLTTSSDYSIDAYYKWDLGVSSFRTSEWETLCFPMNAAVLSSVDEDDLATVKQLAIEVDAADGETTAVDVADIRLHDNDLPPGVVWMFDDGHVSTYNSAFPYLAAAGYVGTVGPMPDNYGPTDADYCTIAQLQEMHTAGWGCFSHYETQYTSVSLAQAQANMRTAKSFLLDNGLTRDSDFLAWPNSSYDTDLEDLALRPGLFTHLRRFGTSYHPSVYATPYITNRRSIPEKPINNSTTVTEALADMDDLAAYGGVQILVIHDLQESGPTGAGMLGSSFETMVDYAETLGLASYTLTDLYGGLTALNTFGTQAN